MEFQNLIYEKGKVARIILNRPERMNALSNDLLRELKQALIAAERDPDVRVIIIKGAGRTFSAGYDLEKYPTTDEASKIPTELAQKDHVNFRQDVWWTIWDLLKPVIAQVHGYALAGASELASMCDVTIVAEDARIGYPPVRAMSTPDTLYQPWLMGLKKAKLFCFTGDSISGKEAVEWGYATLAVPADQLEEATTRLAERIALVPSDLLTLQKQGINRTFEIMGIRTAIEFNCKIHDLAGQLPSAKEFRRRSIEEGVNAALEWRDGPFGDYRVKTKSEPKQS